MGEVKHTPGPWKRIALGGSSTIVSESKPGRNDTRIPSYGYRDEEHCIAYPFIEDDGRVRWDFVCFSHEDAAFIVEAANSFEAREVEIKRLRQALGDVINPIENLKRLAEQKGAVLNGNAYTIANSLSFVQSIARDALNGGSDVGSSPSLHEGGRG